MINSLIFFAIFFSQSLDYSQFLGKEIGSFPEDKVVPISDLKSLYQYFPFKRDNKTKIYFKVENNRIINIKIIHRSKNFDSIIDSYLVIYGEPNLYYRYIIPSKAEIIKNSQNKKGNFTEGYLKPLKVNKGENANIAIWEKDKFTIKLIDNYSEKKVTVTIGKDLKK